MTFLIPPKSQIVEASSLAEPFLPALQGRNSNRKFNLSSKRAPKKPMLASCLFCQCGVDGPGSDSRSDITRKEFVWRSRFDDICGIVSTRARLTLFTFSILAIISKSATSSVIIELYSKLSNHQDVRQQQDRGARREFQCIPVQLPLLFKAYPALAMSMQSASTQHKAMQCN